MDDIGLIRKQLKDIEFRLAAIEHRLSTEGVPPASAAADVGERLIDVKNGILGAASSLLSKAANTIKPTEPNG